MDTDGWERIYKEQGEVQSEILPQVREAVKYFKEKGYRKILDLCCGTGRHTIYLAREGFIVYATDISETGLKITKKKAREFNLNNIIFRQHDMRDIPFKENYFDAIICVWSTGHGNLKDVKTNINEMYRVLKPQGTLVTDFISIDDETFGKGVEVEPNTFIGSIKGEEDITHHYSTRNELELSFSKFKQAQIIPVTQTYKAKNGKYNTIKKFDVIAIK